MRRELCQACRRAARIALVLCLGLVLPVVPAVVGGCAATGGPRAPRVPRTDRNLLTQEQMLATRHTNLYDVVEALRSNWLRTHGVDSFATPTPVWVYFDDARLGGIESLRAISPQTVTYVRYYDGPGATARWGVGHGQGVIAISSYPR